MNKYNIKELLNKNNSSSTKKKAKKFYSRLKNWLSNALFFLFLMTCFLFLWKIQTEVVDGISMLPTFTDGDRLLALKDAEPKRYDIVTFVPKGKPKESYIKRVIGLPGDVIWIKENNLFINHQLSKIPARDILESLSETDLPDGTIKVNITPEVRIELEGYITIPKGHYFVLGDNRNHSNDSRALGLIKEEQLQGTVFFRYFPFQNFGFVH